MHKGDLIKTVSGGAGTTGGAWFSFFPHIFFILPFLFLFRPIPAEITSGRRDKGNQQAAHLHTMPKGYPAPYVLDDKKDKKEYPAGIS